MAIIDEARAAGNEPCKLLIIAPILPGKSEAWRRFIQELHGSRRGALGAACWRLGIVRESVWLVTTRGGDWALVEVAMAQGAPCTAQRCMPDGSFEHWQAAQLRALHGFDLNELCAGAHAELIVAWQSEIGA